MDAKKLIPFAIILVILGGLVLLKSQNNEPQSIITQTKLQSLVPEDINADDVKRLKLYAAGNEEEAVELVREGDNWKVASNFNAPAKEETVTEYIDKVLEVRGEPRAKNVSEEKLADYSLKDDEAFRVQAFTSGDSPAIDLLVGKAADFRTIFLREPGGNTVYTEAVNLRSDAGVFGEDMTQAPTADKWLDKDVLSIEQEKVTRVALTMPDKSLVFEREEAAQETPEPAGDAEEENVETPAPPVEPEYSWNLTEGGGGRTFNQMGLDKVLTKLASLQATNVVDPEKLGEYALETPAFRAEIGVEDGGPIVIEAGRPTLTGNGYLRLASNEDSSIYEVSRYNMDQLFPKGSELFDLPEIGATADSVSRIEVTQGSNRVVLAKTGENWAVEAPVAALETQDSKITSAASALAVWKAADYAEADADTGIFDRTVTFTVNGATRSISAGGDAKSTDGVYVKLDNKPEIYVMSRTDAAKVFLAPRDVYQLSVLDFDETTAENISATVDGKGINLAKAGTSWTVTADGGSHKADTDAVDDLLSTLTEFQVSDFDTTRTEANWSPRAAVTVRTADGAEHGLNFGPMEGGSHPTTATGQSTIFTTNPGVVSRIASQLEALATPPAPEETPTETPAEESGSDEASVDDASHDGHDHDHTHE